MPLLTWLTREEDIEATKHVAYRLLEEVHELSTGDGNNGNMLIQANNLDALKTLLPFYTGRIKCVYIDPLSTAAGICTGAAAQKCTTGWVGVCPRSPWEGPARGSTRPPRGWRRPARGEGPVVPRGQAGLFGRVLASGSAP